MNKTALIAGIFGLGAPAYMAVNGYNGLFVAIPLLLFGVLLSRGVIGS